MQQLLNDIELFLSTHGMKPTAFGEKALGDKHLVRQLRAGRRVWPETENSIRQFMVSYRPDTEKAAA
jgi:hypothetical protein